MVEYRRTTRTVSTKKASVFGPADIVEEEYETFIQGTAEEITHILNKAEFREDDPIAEEVTLDDG